MLALRLVRLIETHSETLAHELQRVLLDSHACSDLRKVPPRELHARTLEICRDLSDWLTTKSEAEIAELYQETGSKRATQGVRLSHLIAASALTKEYLVAYLDREGLADGAVELHGELTLVELLGQFIDRALYHMAVGHERTSAARGEHAA